MLVYLDHPLQRLLVAPSSSCFFFFFGKERTVAVVLEGCGSAPLDDPAVLAVRHGASSIPRCVRSEASCSGMDCREG